MILPGLKSEAATMATSTPGHSDLESDLGMEPLWTVEDVACYLRLNPETVRIMARRGELPSIKVGRRVWRFKISEIRDWLKLQHETVGTDSDRSASTRV